MYNLYKVIHQLLQKFPKVERYTLGQTVQTTLLKLIEQICLASTAEKYLKINTLQQAGAKLDLLKLLIRLAHETECLNQKQCITIEQQLDEIGRMLGGWIRSLR